ncbi:MAG TPA: hypothetical protein VK762_08360 [Polyangiaceae bacterium]|jgi:hypothetical protein|nr:hypothetical protein [Polyangiaceae bacterium]
MTKRPEIVAALFAAGASVAAAAQAQPNLPPPPPPPIDQPSEVPSLPPPPPRQTSPAESPPAPPPRRQPTPPPPPPYRSSSVRSRRSEDVVVYVEPPMAYPVAVTLNPLGLFRGRLSANLEVQLEPHHSLFVSPNVLVFHTDRGDADNLISEGFGFATPTSSSIGVEFGYHYWWHWARALRGPYFGPALLLGSTTDASVGDPTHAQSYWGLAFDTGWQEVLPGGFTAGIGLGLELVRMAGTGAVVPRLLLQLGWSF